MRKIYATFFIVDFFIIDINTADLNREINHFHNDRNFVFVHTFLLINTQHLLCEIKN